MHPSSRENMLKCFEQFVQGPFLDERDVVHLLDVGAADVNGSYRQVFSDSKIVYIGADMQEAAGVDLVLRDPYKIPMSDSSVDIVVSGQMLEHCEFFWLSFQEMIRVLKPDGFLFLIAPSSGPEHRFPVDCYRFYPDAFRALAKFAGAHLVDVWRDDRGPWCDLVGVFRKSYPLPAKPIALAATSSPVTPGQPVRKASEEAETTKGTQSYLKTLALCHEVLQPRLYLEIGVRRGHSLALASGPAIGVDPHPDVQCALSSEARVVQAKSDHFFATQATEALDRPLDLAFIDGLHLFEFALRDFMAIERRAHAATLVVIDDVFPNHELQASRDRQTAHWSGDVWKLMDVLIRRRPDLVMLPLDVSPAGLLLITGLDADNRELWQNYNPLCAYYQRDDLVPPRHVLSRATARDPRDDIVREGLQTLRTLRENSADLMRFRSAMSAWTIAQ